jgi:hypothetical protein
MLDYFGSPVGGAAPAKWWSRLEPFLDFVIKIGVLATAIGGLVVYTSFTRHQNELALLTAKLQVERSSIENPLDIGKKAALGVSTQPRLGIDLLSANDVGGSPARYLVVWEVGIVNRGNRTINVEANQAELYVGSERNPTPKAPTIFEFNHPRPDWITGPHIPAIEWHPQEQSILKRKFSASDLYGAAIGPMSPGDKRVSEISGIVSGHPGMWLFALARISVRAEQETSEQVEWAYDVLPQRSSKQSDHRAQNATTPSK